MCTSIISNGNKTIIGFNLDILNMEYRVRAEEDKVYIAIQDDKEGWLPLFGANSRGDFVAMPTCWPFDERSNPANADSLNIINLDIDLLLRKKTLDEIKAIAEHEAVSSVPGVTFQSHQNRNTPFLQISHHSKEARKGTPGWDWTDIIRLSSFWRTEVRILMFQTALRF